MAKHHPDNVRIKYRYFAYLEEARRMSVTSVDQVAAAISQFEEATDHRDFRLFHIELARKFKRMLAETVSPTTGKPLATATACSRLFALKAFFIWRAGQPGYKSRMNYSDADYFNPSNNDGRIAHAVRQRPAPTMEQISHVLGCMPNNTPVERRDRALIAFTIVSGARDNAIASMSLRHVDVTHQSVIQDAREVRTKNRKTFTSNFFPVGDEIKSIVTDWIAYLRTEKLFGPSDPLFPSTEILRGASGHFENTGLSQNHWSNAGAIRRIFRAAFEAAGLPYFNPHSFRRTLTALGENLCKTPESFKSWSQNLGHEHVLTTFTSYGAVASHRQAEILLTLDRHKDGAVDDDALNEVIAFLQRKVGGASKG
jgi:integrase